MPESLSGREKAARRAIDRLGTERLLAFFRAIQTDGRPLAAKLLNDDLKAGKTLESVFLTGEAEGFYLNVKGRGRRFRIEFGYLSFGLGDGGTWDVEFDGAGQVSLGEESVLWMS